MVELWINPTGWRKALEALTGESVWGGGGGASTHGDFVHGIPTTLQRQSRYTLGPHGVVETAKYLLRMVGNGTLLEELAFREIRLQGAQPIRLLAVDRHPGFFVHPDTPEVREKLSAWKPKRRRRPAIPEPLLKEVAPVKPRRQQRAASGGGGSNGEGAYVCPVGHVHGTAERDPINDAFFCIECGAEIR